MGLTVLSLASKQPVRRRWPALTLLVPLHASVVRLAAGPVGGSNLVDPTTWASVPPGAHTLLETVSPASRVLALEVRPRLVRAAVELHGSIGFSEQRLLRYAESIAVLPRTTWVHELCHRYLFEREALQHHDNEVTRFVEVELLKEVFFLFRDREDGAERSPLVHRNSPTVAAAVEFIEANLFEGLGLQVLCRRLRASESTLLRAFKRELGLTPAAYWRGRRLDEALALLRTGAASIATVALKVGYDNPAAFAEAFRVRFGQSPSRLINRKRVRPPP